MVVDDLHLVCEAELREDAGELGRCVVEDDLFERFSVFGDIFYVVVAGVEEEYVSAVDLVPDIAVVDILLAAEDVSYSVSGEVVGLDTVAVGLDILGDYGLLNGWSKMVDHSSLNL